MRRGILGTLLVLVLLLSSTTTAQTPAPFNILVFMTDDQRWDTMWAMPITTTRIGGRGVTFANAFVTTPLCCPVRASFLSGGLYPDQTGVLSNQEPNGSATAFQHGSTMALSLQRAGYRTALIGRYLNGYRQQLPMVPPGWSLWVETATIPWGEDTETFSWFHYWTHAGRSRENPTRAKSVGPWTQYTTDFIADRTVRFLQEETSTGPFFAWITFPAPHYPAWVAPEDEGLFPDYTYSGRGYGEADLSDKPAWVRGRAASFDRKILDRAPDFPRRQLQTLAATDRAIGRILDALEARGLAERTLVVFTSDNGYQWGEHQVTGKIYPYEESIRVPLIMALPGGRQNATESGLIAMNLDVPATIMALAAVPRRTQGFDLTPRLRGPAPRPRETLILQSWSPISAVRGDGGWAAIRDSQWKYVEHDDGSRELYDVLADPFELQSLHTSADHQARIAAFAATLHARMGLTMTVVQLPPARVGVRYVLPLTAAGGQAPYNWQVTAGGLAPGLVLTQQGRIEGRPTAPGTYEAWVQVADDSVRLHAGGPQRFTREFTLRVDP